MIADNEEEMSPIALGTAFGGITDIETGPDGFFYLLTVNRNLDDEWKFIEFHYLKNTSFFRKPANLFCIYKIQISYINIQKISHTIISTSDRYCK